MAPPQTERPAVCALPPRALFRLALMQGLSPMEAGRLTAWCKGIEVTGTTSTWTARQVEAVLFLRYLRERDRWSP